MAELAAQPIQSAGSAWSGHAVVLMVFQRPEQTQWLVEQVVRLGAFVLLHVDRKSLARFSDLIDYLASCERVAIVQDPISVNWAGFSQVEATLRGIALAQAKCPDYRVLHLMSGECLPLISFHEMDRIMRAEHTNEDLIDSHWKPEYAWRINRYSIFGEHPKNRTHWYNLAFKKLRDAQRPFPPRRNFTAEEIFKGSQWWSIRAGSLRQMFAGVDMQDYCKRFRWTRCSDEHFFQILHRRAALQAAVVGNRRYDEFPPGVASPRYLTLDDVDCARARGCFFARKVELDVARRYWEGRAVR